MDVLTQAKNTWEAMAPLRQRRERYLRFTYGRQWDDPVVDPVTGRTVTERQLLAKDGRTPLTNNLLRQLVKSIVGRFRSVGADITAFEPETAVVGIAGARQPDTLTEKDARLLEEFLISSMAVQRVGTDEYSRNKYLPVVENISPAQFFVNAFRDPCGSDITLVGAIHRMQPEEVVMRWGGSRRQVAMSLLEQLKALAEGSGATDDWPGVADEFGAAQGAGLVGVVEAWRLEPFESYRVHDPEAATFGTVAVSEAEKLRAENRRRRKAGRPLLIMRWQLTRRWVGRWYLPDGTLLDTVRDTGTVTHPFVVKFYPLVDGEVHSLIEDVIDQQKYVNRLINLLDRMMATAAKGALLYPVDCLPEGCEFADVANQWSATDGIVLYKQLPGDVPPRQLTTTVGDVGARDLLQVQMKLFKEISGVGDTLAGRTVPAGVGAERYSLELENASVSIRDLLDTFRSLLALRNLRLAGSAAE